MEFTFPFPKVTKILGQFSHKWFDFTSRFHHHQEQNGRKRISFLLHFGGNIIKDVSESCQLSSDDYEWLLSCIEFLEHECLFQIMISFMRYLFFNHSLEAGLGVEDFYKELKLLSQWCSFDDNTIDDVIKNRIINSLHEERVRKVFMDADSLTASDVVNVCSNVEKRDDLAGSNSFQAYSLEQQKSSFEDIDKMQKDSQLSSLLEAIIDIRKGLDLNSLYRVDDSHGRNDVKKSGFLDIGGKLNILSSINLSTIGDMFPDPSPTCTQNMTPSLEMDFHQPMETASSAMNPSTSSNNDSCGQLEPSMPSTSSTALQPSKTISVYSLPVHKTEPSKVRVITKIQAKPILKSATITKSTNSTIFTLNLSPSSVENNSHDLSLSENSDNDGSVAETEKSNGKELPTPNSLAPEESTPAHSSQDFKEIQAALNSPDPEEDGTTVSSLNPKEDGNTVSSLDHKEDGTTVSSLGPKEDGTTVSTTVSPPNPEEESTTIISLDLKEDSTTTSSVDLKEDDTVLQSISSKDGANDIIPNSFCFQQEAFSKMSQIKENIGQSTDMYSCNFCVFYCPDKASMESHVLQAHKIKSFKCIMCTSCNEEFHSKDQFESHIRNKHMRTEEHKCPVCYKVYDCQKKLFSHFQEHAETNTVRCEICGTVFFSNHILSRHMSILHPEAYPWNCSTCGARFQTKHQLNGHKGNVDECKSKKIDKCKGKKVKVKINKSKQYTCQPCGLNFTCKKSSIMHKLQFHRKKPLKIFKCDSCSYRCAANATLVSHIRTHTGEKPFICEICGRGFSQTSVLDRHLRTHTGEKPYKCQYCSRAFITSSNRLIHERRHRNERPFVCEQCGKTFHSSYDLKIHFQTHSESRIRPFVCHCGAAFFKRKVLKIHQVSHLRTKPYTCDVCGAGFTRPENLKSHQNSQICRKRALKIHTEEQ